MKSFKSLSILMLAMAAVSLSASSDELGMLSNAWVHFKDGANLAVEFISPYAISAAYAPANAIIRFADKVAERTYSTMNPDEVAKLPSTEIKGFSFRTNSNRDLSTRIVWPVPVNYDDLEQLSSYTTFPSFGAETALKIATFVDANSGKISAAVYAMPVVAFVVYKGYKYFKGNKKAEQVE